MGIPPELLRILRCPRCRGPVTPTPSGEALACARCALAYPVADGVPVMIVEEASPLAPGPGGPGAAP